MCHKANIYQNRGFGLRGTPHSSATAFLLTAINNRLLHVSIVYNSCVSLSDFIYWSVSDQELG